MQHPAEFTPQSDYLATRAQLIGSLDQQTLVYLYQPLIGPVAAALYQTLWTQVRVHPMFTQDRRPHSSLLETLGVEIDTLYTARVRLEAVGLMKTYTQVDTERHFVYEMYAPLRPADFLKDDLLSIALYDTVGPDRYQELASSFTITPVRRSDMTDISRKFLDVFQIAGDLTNPAPTVEAARDTSAEQPSPQVRVDANQVDWELLGKLLAKSGIGSSELHDRQSAITAIAGFYGLSTSALARIIARAIDGLTGKINVARMRSAAEQEYSKGESRIARNRRDDGGAATAAVAPAASSDDEQVKYTAVELQLLKNAKSMSIREFLTVTKKRKDPQLYAAPNELFALRKLSERNVFDVATINVLVDYVLQDSSSINASYLDAVANAWIEAKVDSPERAIAQVRAYKAGKTKPQQKRSQGKRKQYGRPQRKETVPNWAKKDYVAPKPVVSAKVRAELNAKLKQLDSGKKKED
ncbi:replication initiation and membrane attachment family protein [Lacticaseibacillus zhaodongensis]|uniref:replication initiation and membrane attachment family protein n=1 Tax=Lacticaseibacillus zhaodongensis TaxID=2668065 RepID=UPI0018AF5BE6|nr:DnaD domain protein [Lacticaseibacillus zhaodongensis]